MPTPAIAECADVPTGIRSLGIPDLLLCRGLQYLDTPSMIQTGLIPLHPAAIDEYRTLHG